ncbi:MAG TPA: hypothetical protein VF638_07190 [Sphingomonas sp.]
MVDVPVLLDPPVLPMPLLPLLVPDPVLPRDRLLEPRFACLPRVERWLDALVPPLDPPVLAPVLPDVPPVELPPMPPPDPLWPDPVWPDDEPVPPAVPPVCAGAAAAKPKAAAINANFAEFFIIALRYPARSERARRHEFPRKTQSLLDLNLLNDDSRRVFRHYE